MSRNTPELPPLPWAEWARPEVVNTEIHDVRLACDDERFLFVRDSDQSPIGQANRNSLRELSTRISFPVDFVQKLSPEIQTQVVNDRIRSARKQEFSFIKEGDQVTHVAPGWREAAPHSDVAQVAYEQLRDFARAEVMIERAYTEAGQLDLRLMTPVEESITPKVGDVLQMGIDVRHGYGMDLSVGLFTKRLVCTNGMCSTQRDYQWTTNASGTVNEQLRWVRSNVEMAANAYHRLIDQARRMAETRVEGDLSAALLQRARSMNIPRRFDAQVLEAWETEPGNTEWDLLNALTRFATHMADEELGRRIQFTTGRTVESFDLVTARLPRYVAQYVGGSILEEDAYEEIAAAVS